MTGIRMFTIIITEIDIKHVCMRWCSLRVAARLEGCGGIAEVEGFL
jgi:hypothetical protein